MRIRVPESVREILEKLTGSGYEAYGVGGCVRDSLLGLVPHDWDVCTSALPEQTEACFRGYRLIETGMKHGTVTVLADGEPIEITTYRVDGTYSDGRHPDSVSFTRSLREDLARRDFTVNAMACSAEGNVWDYFGGQEDLKAGLLRCVGTPGLRFTEDALRILRALRFSAVYGFRIEESTAHAARLLADRLELVSEERRLTELRKLLCGRAAGEILESFPEILAAACPGLETEIVLKNAKSVGRGSPEEEVRFALLLRGTDAENILRRLKAENALIREVSGLVSLSDAPLPGDEIGLKQLLRDRGAETVRRLIALQKALGDSMADGASESLRNILDSGACYRTDMLAVKGSDLVRAGFRPGPDLGKLLAHLLDAVICGKTVNTEKALLEEAEKFNAGGKDHDLRGKTERHS